MFFLQCVPGERVAGGGLGWVQVSLKDGRVAGVVLWGGEVGLVPRLLLAGVSLWACHVVCWTSERNQISDGRGSAALLCGRCSPPGELRSFAGVVGSPPVG